MTRRFAVAVIIATLALSTPLLPPPVQAQNDPVVLRVGDLSEMRTRNAIATTLGPFGDADEWGTGILRPVYSTPVLRHPATREVVPYLAKGIDANENGVFDTGEYGVFAKAPGTNETDITLYFDLNGVRWHDGVSMSPTDILFSLHLAALRADLAAFLRPLTDRGGGPGSNFTWERWLAVGSAAKSWAGEGAMPGVPGLRFAFRFRLQAPYPAFVNLTLNELWLLPRHVWEGTGGDRHPDFGRLVYPEGHPRAGQGIPRNETAYTPFDFTAAASWTPSDENVVGSGPFRFVSRISGGPTRLARYADYFVGADPADPGIVYDGRLAAYLHRPFVDEIEFRLFRTIADGIAALEADEVDYLRWIIPPEWVPRLMLLPRVRLWASPEAGYVYLAHNMRQPPYGYARFPPVDSEADDAGKPFRRAIAHLTDKAVMVGTLLQNFGIIGQNVVSPANTAWHNASVPTVPYDPALASAVLDNAGWIDTDDDGWRDLPRIGDGLIPILTPMADYDAVRASAAAIIASRARGVGLNVTTSYRPYDPFDPWTAFREGTFELAVAKTTIDSADPDFLFSFFHSEGRSNLAGYRDADFDRIVDASRATLDRVERQRLVKMAQGVLMDDRPVEPLYFQTRIDATQRFENWTHALPLGLWNFWSWISVRPVDLPNRSPRIEIRYDTGMVSGRAQMIEVAVRNETGAALDGARVDFEILPLQVDAGRFVESQSLTVTGTTGSTGVFAATYEAPVVFQPRWIGIRVEVTHPAYSEPARRYVFISVFPPPTQFLTLRVALPSGDLTVPGSPLPVHTEVRDETGASVPDATVRASLTPPNGSLDPETGSSAQMSRILFTPANDLEVRTAVRISLVAEKVGYVSAVAAVYVDVVPLDDPRITNPPPGQDGLAIVAGVAVSSIVAAAVAAAALRRRGTSRR